MQRPSAFGISVLAHVVLVVFLAAVSAGAPDRPRSLYDQEIRPHERELIWYNLQTKLPAIRPTEASQSKAPARAVHQAPQPIVSAHKEDPKPVQKIWVPDAPTIEPPKPTPLPNLLAVAPTPPVLPPPPPKPIKKFTPEAPKPIAASSPHNLLDAPQITQGPAAIAKLNVDVSAPVRTVKRFTPAAVARAQANAPSAIEPPPTEVSLPPTPGATATMAIVGLDPAKSMKIPEPPAPRDAGFSAGPTPHPTGFDNLPTPKSAVAVPELAAAGEAKDARATPSAELSSAARQNLLAAMRMGAGLNPTVPLGTAPPPRPVAPRVTSSPDPRMAGREVHTMAIQMPNVTSYSGSWMVWFAERNPVAESHPVISGPEAVRKVDPRYVADAVRDGVEGVVRLTAIIRRDGTIENIELLKHLDARLDATAEEALSKWKFLPATRDGAPVDVDAVFEVPFRLPPKELR